MRLEGYVTQIRKRDHAEPVGVSENGRRGQRDQTEQLGDVRKRQPGELDRTGVHREND